MSEIISPKEMQELLSVAKSKEKKERKSKDYNSSRKFFTYSLHQSDFIPKDQLQVFHNVFKTFASRLSNTLSAQLRSLVEIDLKFFEHVPFQEFYNSVGVPTCLVLARIPDTQEAMYMEISANLVFSILDKFLGGPGSIEEPDRELTEIEQELTMNFCASVLKNLARVLKPISGHDNLQFIVDSIITNIFLFPAAAHSEMIVFAECETTFEKMTGHINFALPTRMIEFLSASMSDQNKVNQISALDKSFLNELSHRVADIPVKVEGHILGFSMTLQDFLDLEINDVIVLKNAAESKALLVEDSPKFIGDLVKINKNKGFKIHKPVDAD